MTPHPRGMPERTAESPDLLSGGIIRNLFSQRIDGFDLLLPLAQDLQNPFLEITRHFMKIEAQTTLKFQNRKAGNRGFAIYYFGPLPGLEWVTTTYCGHG